MKKSDLKRAGIKNAKRVVILAPSIQEISQFTENKRYKLSKTAAKTDDDSEITSEFTARKLSREEEDLLDSKTIFKYNMISKMNKNVFCVIELINPKNVSHLNNVNRRSNDEYRFIKAGLTIDATASFAAGEVYYSSIMDNVITQAYYNPSLLSVLKKLIVGDELPSTFKSQGLMNKYSNVASGSLYLIDLPVSLFRSKSNSKGSTGEGIEIRFDKIFKSLLKKKIIVIGVYRFGQLNQKKDEKPKAVRKDSIFYYVVTAPEEDFLVTDKDKLFVISPEYPRPESLDKNANIDYYKKNEENDLKDHLRIKTRKMSSKKDVRKEMDEDAENKLVTFNESLEYTKGLIDEIQNTFNKITGQADKYIKNSIKKKLFSIKNKDKE